MISPFLFQGFSPKYPYLRAMKAELHKVVSVSYRLLIKENNEEIVVETAEASDPMVFIFGASGLPPKFEEALSGKAQGDGFRVSLEPIDAFGEYQDDVLSEVPKDVFMSEEGVFDTDEVDEGAYLQLEDEDGYLHKGKVVSIGDETIVMDFNHPLAGVPVTFDGEVVDIREAQPEELAHGHVQGQGGVNH